jgi:hypothetical protein
VGVVKPPCMHGRLFTVLGKPLFVSKQTFARHADNHIVKFFLDLLSKNGRLFLLKLLLFRLLLSFGESGKFKFD